jgi:WD40 repeat protein
MTVRSPTKLLGHHSKIHKIEFGEREWDQSEILASCSDDKIVKVWTDLQEGKFINIDLTPSLLGPNNTLSQIAFTPLSDHLLFGSVQGDFGVSLVETGKSMILQNLNDSIQEIKVPNDGVICALMNSTNISIYDLVKQCLFHSFSSSSNDLMGNSFDGTCLDFGNKAGRLMIGTQQGNIDFLDLRQKKPTNTINLSNHSIQKLAVHPYDDLMMVGDSQGCLKV